MSRGDPIQKKDTDLLEWIRRFQSKDTTAITPIYQKTQSRLFRFCLHLTGDSLQAEELTQEVFLKLFTKMDNQMVFETEDKFFSWVFRITKNAFLNIRRTSEAKLIKRKQVDPAEDRTDLISRLPESQSVDVETLLALKETLSKLPEEDRIIILLIDHEEYSYVEAARIMAISEGAIRMRIHHIRKLFQKLYEGRENKTP